MQAERGRPALSTQNFAPRPSFVKQKMTMLTILRFFVLLLLGSALLGGCQPSAEVTIKDSDGAAVSVSLPQGLTATELIQLRGMTDAVLTIRADKQIKTYQWQQARQAAQQATAARRDDVAVAVFGMGCLSVVTITLGGAACYFFGRRGGRPLDQLFFFWLRCSLRHSPISPGASLSRPI